MTNERAPITREKRILHLGGSRLRYREFNKNIEPLVEEAGGIIMVRSASASAFLLGQGGLATQHLKGTTAEEAECGVRQQGGPRPCEPVYLAQIDSYFWSEGTMLAGIVDKAYEKTMALRDDELMAGSKAALQGEDDESFLLWKTCLKLRSELTFEALGRILKSRRETSGFTVPMLANEMGVSIATIYRWEKQGRLPLYQLSRYLKTVGIDVDEHLKSLNLNAIPSPGPEGREKP